MNFDLQQIFSEMGFVALAIVAVLGVMAVASLAVFAERTWSFLRTRAKALSFGAAAGKFLQSNDFSGLQTYAVEQKGNSLAKLIAAGVKCYRTAMTKHDLSLSPTELTRRELQRNADTLAAQLRRGLNVLASVGSVAPFVGLLGTVVGIIDAFRGIAAEGSGGLGAVSAGIAEALVVTAIGLMVAIPAVLMFNYLSSKADSLELALDQARGEFLDYIEALGDAGTSTSTHREMRQAGGTEHAKQQSVRAPMSVDMAVETHTEAQVGAA